MGKTIMARFSKGVIKPLERVDIAEGKEITVTIMEVPTPSEKKDALEATAGGWKGLVDAEELKRHGTEEVTTEEIENRKAVIARMKEFGKKLADRHVNLGNLILEEREELENRV